MLEQSKLGAPITFTITKAKEASGKNGDTEWQSKSGGEIFEHLKHFIT